MLSKGAGVAADHIFIGVRRPALVRAEQTALPRVQPPGGSHGGDEEHGPSVATGAYSGGEE